MSSGVKTIVVTGTRKGIGKEISEHYLSKGYRVFGCSRGPKSIENENYTHFSLDVADEKAVVDMVAEVSRSASRIDVLLNNAGIASMNHVLTSPYQTAKDIFNTNFFGTFLFLREVSKVMLKQRYGRIINFATVATPLRLEGEALYAASKAAVVNLTEICARELSDFGITVNAVGPTPIRTDLIKNVPEENIHALLNRQAIKRVGTVDDIVNVIDFFIDDKSDFVTGQIVYLGGING
jgi:3-oxoacyl-[acyl-carrier protein] reductase